MTLTHISVQAIRVLSGLTPTAAGDPTVVDRDLHVACDWEPINYRDCLLTVQVHGLLEGEADSRLPTCPQCAVLADLALTGGER